MKIILLQIIAVVCAIPAIVGIKIMNMPAWITYPLLTIVVVLTLLGLAGAHYERKSVEVQSAGTVVD
jgi:purine-cytosine permease-like protein